MATYRISDGSNPYIGENYVEEFYLKAEEMYDFI